MARDTLIPRTRGDIAIDKLLNQTLPRILENQQRRQDRQQNRQDTLDAIEREKERWKFSKEQTAIENARADEKSLITKLDSFSKVAYESAAVGKFKLGAAQLQGAKDYFEKNHPGFDLSPYNIDASIEEFNTTGSARNSFEQDYEKLLTENPQDDGSAFLKMQKTYNLYNLTQQKKFDDRVETLSDSSSLWNFRVDDAHQQGAIDKIYTGYYDAKGTLGFSNLKDSVQKTLIENLASDVGTDTWIKMTTSQKNQAVEQEYYKNTSYVEADQMKAKAYLQESFKDWSKEEIRDYMNRDDVTDLKKRELVEALRWGYSYGYGYNNLVEDGVNEDGSPKYEKDKDGMLKRVLDLNNEDSLDWHVHNRGVPKEWLTQESLDSWRKKKREEIQAGEFIPEDQRDYVEFWKENTIVDTKNASLEEIEKAKKNLKEQWKTSGSKMIASDSDRKKYKSLMRDYNAELSLANTPGSARDKEAYKNWFKGLKPRRQEALLRRWGSFEKYYQGQLPGRKKARFPEEVSGPGRMR
jgi:hypothetical protein